MSWYQQPDFWGLVGAFIISTISGFISIARRILMGHPASFLWIISEYLTAILCGYLMYHAYPYLADSLPNWITSPIAIALAAHTGGRVFQEVEQTLLRKYAELFKNRI